MSFTNFPNLPTELQEQIWNDTLPGPRIIRITCKLIIKAPENKFLNALYNTCQASHHIVKKHYKPSFNLQLKAPILFNPSLDTLYFDSPASLQYFYGNSLSTRFPQPDNHVQSLALYTPLHLKSNDEFEFDLQVSGECIYSVLKSLRGLRQVVFVHSFEEGIPREEIVWMLRDFETMVYYLEGELEEFNEEKGFFLKGMRVVVVKEESLNKLLC